MGDNKNGLLPQVGPSVAGESHSSSEDCPTDSGGDNQPLERQTVEMVGNQAVSALISTGKTGPQDGGIPIGRRLARSPIRQRTNSLPDEGERGGAVPDKIPVPTANLRVDQLPPKSTGTASINILEQNPKRKRIEGGSEKLDTQESVSEKDREIQERNRSMTEIVKQVGLLGRLVTEAYKLKKELTNISSKLSYYTAQLQKRVYTTTTQEPHEEMEYLHNKVAELERGANLAKRTEQTLREKIMQLEKKVKELDQGTERANNKKEIEEYLSTEKTLENLANILDQDWPEQVYERTQLHNGNLSQGRFEETRAIFVDPNKIGQETKLEELKTMFPPLGPLFEEGLTEGVMDFVDMQVDFVSSRKKAGKEQYMNSIYILPMMMADNETTDAELMFKLLLQLRDEAKKRDKKIIRLEVIGSTNFTYLRKCTEFVFRDLETKVIMWTKENRKTPRRKSERDGMKNVRLVREKIIVKTQEGKSFAELLKSVKSSVNLEEKGIQVSSIRKTNKGDLVMEVPEGKAAIHKQSIQKKNQNVNIVVKTNETVVHVTDIDASYEENQLKAEISKAENIPEDLFRIISLSLRKEETRQLQ